MNGILWAVRLHFRYPFKTLFTLIVSMGEVLLFISPITITADVISAVMQGAGFQEVQWDFLRLLIIAAIQALVFFSVCFINEVLAHRVTTDMTADFFKTLQEKSLTYHDKIDIGDMMARATGDTRTVNIAISPGIRNVLEVLTMWIVAFVLTLQIHYIFTIITACVFVIFVWMTWEYSKRLIPLSMETRKRFGNLSENINNNLTGVREIKSFIAEMWVKKRYIQKVKEYQTQEIKEGMRAAWFYPIFIVTIYTAMLMVLILYFGYKNLFGIGIKEIVLISEFAVLLLGMSEELGWSMGFLVRAKAGADRLYSVISETDPGSYDDGTLLFDGKTSKIEFRNVSFRYTSTLPWALRHVSFTIDTNQSVVIVGSPGSGKSTIAKLIQRLYHPTEGEILLNDMPLWNYTNTSFHAHLATVEQDISLFNQSVSENISYGKHQANEDEIKKAAKLAEAHEFIMEMPQGYETLIGEGGIRLSGGQAQRLAIARALLVNPSILIMDDGASSLDSKTEQKIQTAIAEILRTHTSIITTHRLSIISKVDLVIMLDKGEIVGIGPHSELIQTSRLYRRLFERHYELPPLRMQEIPEVRL